MQASPVNGDEFFERPQDPKQIEGWRLLDMLYKKAELENLSVTETAARLGISRSYLSSLSYGQRRIPSLGREVLSKCAEFLGVTLAMVLMAAEVITPTDYIGGTREQARFEIQRAMEFLASDPEWAGYVEADWRSWTPKMQLMAVLLYQKACDVKLLPSLFEVKAASEAFYAHRSVETQV